MKIDNDTMVEVSNRTRGTISYEIPEQHIKRYFAQNETKNISIGELKALSYIPGGDNMLKHMLYIKNEEAVDYLQIGVNELYNLTDEDIKNILLNGTLNDLKFFLQKAPQGAIEILKQIAMNFKLQDKDKTDLIATFTNFNVRSALFVEEQLQKAEEDRINELKAKGEYKPTDDTEAVLEKDSTLSNILKNKKTHKFEILEEEKTEE